MRETTAAKDLSVVSRPTPSPRRTKVARCPFCHADAAPRTERVLACEQCGALHHPACWVEGDGCSGCGARAVFDSETAVATPEKPRNRWLTRRRVAAALGLGFVVFFLWVMLLPKPCIVCHFPIRDEPAAAAPGSSRRR